MQDLGSEQLIGRERDLTAVWAGLERAPLVTLVGAGGIGKTALARAAVADRPHRFVDLTSARTAADLRSAVAEAAGVLQGNGATEEEMLDQIGAALREVGGVVVLDNVEQILEPVRRAVTRWLDLGVRDLVATSRETLGLDGEHLLPVTPLDPPAALDLLRRRVRYARHGAGLREAEGEQADQLLRLLDFNPLAVELAAAWLGVLSCSQLVARVGRGTLPGGSGDRHGSLDSVVGWSWDLLPPDRQQALARLALHRAPAPMRALEETLGAQALPQVVDLRRASLVTAEEADGVARIRVFEVVRSYALPRLERSEEARARHAAWVLAALREIGERWRGDPVALRDGGRLVPDALAAFEALGEPDPDTAIAILVAARPFLGRRFSRIDQVTLLERALELSATDGDTRARIADHLAASLGFGRRLEEGIAAARRAVGLAESRAVRDEVTLTLAHLHHHTHRREEAYRIAAEVMRTCEAPTTTMMRMWGHIQTTSGHLEDAIATFEETRELCRARDDKWEEAMVLSGLGRVVVEQERSRGLAFLDRALALAERLEDGQLRTVILNNRALMVAECGPPERLEEVMAAALAARPRMGDVHRRYVEHMGEVARVLATPERPADPMLLAIADAARTSGHLYTVQNATLAWVVRPVLVAPGDPEEALARCRDQAADADHPARIHLQALEGLLLAEAGHSEAAAGAVASIDKRYRPLLDAALRLWAGRGDLSELEEARSAIPRFLGQVEDMILRVAERARQAARTLRIGPDGTWFARGAEPVDLRRRHPARRLLVHLVHARREAPGQAVAPEALVASAWPDERILPEAARMRLHTTVRLLRRLGLADWLETVEGGYRLAPTVAVEEATSP